MVNKCQIHYKGLPASAGVSSYVAAQIAHLEALCQRPPLLGCHVTLELLNHRAGKAASYRAAVELRVPGKQLVAQWEPGRRTEHRDAYAAIRAAFLAATHRLQTHAARLRNGVKHHARASAASAEQVAQA